MSFAPNKPSAVSLLISATLYATAVALSGSGPGMHWLVDVLLCGGIVLTAFNGGIFGAVLALAAASVLTFGARKVAPWDWTGEVLQWTIVIGAALLARDRIARAQQSERKLSALFASLDDASFVLDATGHYAEVWQSPDRPPAPELRGKHVTDVLPAEVADFVVVTLRRALTEQRRVSVDYELQLAGAVTWWNAIVTPIDANHVLWVARDITARKTAENELQALNLQLEQRAQAINADLAAAVDALLESESRHRGIVEQAFDIIFTLDLSGRFMSLNPAFQATVGWPPEEWIGRDFRDLLVESTRKDAEVEFARALASDVMPMTRALVRGRDGRAVMLELSLVNQRVDGQTIGFFGFARDVTGRERAQEDLRRSERQLADTQRIARLGSWEFDVARNRLWWSAEQYRLFGLDPDEQSITMEHFLSLLTPAQRGILARAGRELSEKGEAEWELSFAFDGEGGAETIISCVGRMQRASDGRVLRIFGSAQDITQRRRDEQRLRDSEERFRLMSHATNDVIWDWDLVTNVCWWGDGLMTLFGFELGGAPSIELWGARIHPEDRPRVKATVLLARQSGSPSWSCEYRLRREDGSYAYVMDRGTIVRDEQQTAVRIVGAVTDVTERRRMQEQFAEVSRLSSLGRVAASIAHEFNNVLMGMQTNLEVLQRRTPAQLATPIEHVLHSVRRGKRITDEILGFTRRAAPSLSDVPVGPFLIRWEEEIRPLLGPSIELVIDTAPALYMRADPLQITQVMTNLALNARDAMAGGGVLHITADRRTDMIGGGEAPASLGFVHLRVRDNGAGMSREALGHIFEPLFTTKQGGTGLGLAITHQIVSRHEGFISAESEPGHGTTFDLLLPAAVLSEDAAEVPVAVSPHCHNVVIVDDDLSVVAGLQTLLELDHIRVSVATRGADAVALIEKERPDAVILDIGLPDMSGADVYELIASRWPELPVLFSSGHGDAERLAPWLLRPNVAFLLKPYDYSTLQSGLSALLENRRDWAGSEAEDLRVM